MDHHKHHTPLSIIIILFAIILGAIYLVKEDNSIPKPDTTTTPPPPVVAQAPYKCGMTVSSPMPNSKVTSPIIVTGIINNSSATDGCRWTLFEGQGGTVSLSSGATTYATVPNIIAGDWMTSSPVAFSASLSPQNPIPSGTLLTLTFSEEDPSGQGQSDTFSYQVIAQ